MTYCYNCGAPISKKEGTETKEHIPAQNLFAGFGDEYKKNRIVVPACLKCNRETAHVDEEFRNVIGAISNFSELQAISQNAAKAMITYKRQFNRLHLDDKGSVVAIEFDKKLILDNHVKIFKGLFYHQYKHPIGKEYKIVAFIDPDDSTAAYINYLMENFNWKYSGHPDIFDYILQPFREDINNPSKKDLAPAKDEPFFMSAQRYNKSHAAVVIATSREIKPRA